MSTPDLQVQRDLGKLEARIYNIEKDLEDINKTLKLLVEFFHQIKGGYALLFSVCTVAAGIGSGITYLIGNVFKF